MKNVETDGLGGQILLQSAVENEIIAIIYNFGNLNDS